VVQRALLCAEAGGTLGPRLCAALDDVWKWVAACPPLRPFLFPPAAAAERRRALRGVVVDEPLRAPLAVFAALAEDAGRDDGARLHHACRRIAAWADGRGAPCTAAAFRRAARLVAEEG
jgi:hypothetical protein